LPAGKSEKAGIFKRFLTRDTTLSSVLKQRGGGEAAALPEIFARANEDRGRP
jgi:hypothetical protein